MTPVPGDFIPPRSIDEVIARLDAIIEGAIVERDRLGFFAVLYRTVTAAVKAGIAVGRFEDGPRMERLDVVFANRYLDAFDRLGMNAHINLDLGIAAAEVCPGAALAGLEHDFNEINTVLAALETDVEREVCTLSPWIDRSESDRGVERTENVIEAGLVQRQRRRTQTLRTQAHADDFRKPPYS